VRTHGWRAARSLLLSLGIAALALGAGAAGRQSDRAAGVALTPDALEWQPVPVLAGMTFARVGGTADGPQARFVRIPANGMLPLHRHTATVRVVVVSGTYVYGTQGEPARRFGPGSFIVTPGDVPHVAGCAEACLYYEEVEGRPDFIPVPAAR
jgi:quercetin dioxygenase-like cupin family protein